MSCAEVEDSCCEAECESWVEWRFNPFYFRPKSSSQACKYYKFLQFLKNGALICYRKGINEGQSDAWFYQWALNAFNLWKSLSEHSCSLLTRKLHSNY